MSNGHYSILLYSFDTLCVGILSDSLFKAGDDFILLFNRAFHVDCNLIVQRTVKAIIFTLSLLEGTVTKSQESGQGLPKMLPLQASGTSSNAGLIGSSLGSSSVLILYHTHTPCSEDCPCVPASTALATDPVDLPLPSDPTHSIRLPAYNAAE
jgi:hypothetical protein